jgi:Fe-S cluster assembly protein SufD
MITETLTDQKILFRAMAKNEPGWLHDLRRRAWEVYQDADLPLRVEHIWKYTKPEWFLPDNIQDRMNVLPQVSKVKENEIAPLKQEFAAFGCNHGERLTYTQIANDLKSSGLIYLDLMNAIQKHGDLVQRYLGKLVGYDFGKFEALNLALWNSGMFLYIPNDLILEKPIYIHRHPDEKYNMARLLVVVGSNSKATIIDDYAGKMIDNSYNANSAIEIFAGQNSDVRFVSPQNINQKSRSYVTQRAQVDRDARYYSIFVSLGADVSKYNLGAILNGKGANSQMLGILFGDGKQHFDHHTTHHHKAGETYSNIDFKVVLKDKALSAYTGLIRIDEKTLNCEAYQENRNLLLNPGTRAESIPELEILNDEVRCSHGATVGPIDPEMVFYLRSRGYSYEEAVKAIVAGFIEPLLLQVPEDLRQMMKNMVEFKLQAEPQNRKLVLNQNG